MAKFPGIISGSYCIVHFFEEKFPNPGPGEKFPNPGPGEKNPRAPGKKKKERAGPEKGKGRALKCTFSVSIMII